MAGDMAFLLPGLSITRIATEPRRSNRSDTRPVVVVVVVAGRPTPLDEDDGGDDGDDDDDDDDLAALATARSSRRAARRAHSRCNRPRNIVPAPKRTLLLFVLPAFCACRISHVTGPKYLVVTI